MASGSSQHFGMHATSIDAYLPQRLTRISWHRAAYLLQNIADELESVMCSEMRTLSMSRLNAGIRGMRMPLWRRAENVRELCDVCHTTIFNLHYICESCAFAVCADCVRSRNSIRTRSAETTRDDSYDWYQWPLCTNAGTSEAHQPRLLHLAQLLPDRYPTILGTMAQVRERMKAVIARFNITTSCVCDDGARAMKGRCFCLRIPPHVSMSDTRYICNNRLLLIPSHSPHLLSQFQRSWRISNPIVVCEVAFTRDLWQPSVFRSRIADIDGLETAIVDCRTGKAVGYCEQRKNGVRLMQFWNGFGSHRNRVCDPKTKNVMYLKLKDFPTNASFADALPEHYADFCRALPVPEYTLPELASDGCTGGSLNLVTRLPRRYVRPDLGPKMYNAYGMLYEQSRATTNLHLDITDAVNVMMNVTVPEGTNEDYELQALVNYLQAEGIEESSEEFKRVKANWRKAGAIWTIWHPSDGACIRNFIREAVDEGLLSGAHARGIDDPIHDQRFYLDGALRKLLRERFGIADFTFVQMEGDAVFIPAGAAHQVQNLFSCIKVAEDFVSPEGCRNSAVVTQELRSLTRRHQNHEDKLQLANIMYHAVCEAVAVLEESEVKEEREDREGS